MGLMVDGLDELEQLYASLSEVPQSVLDDMLKAESAVVIAAQKQAAPRKTGDLANSITGSACRTNKTGDRYMDIYPKGIHHHFTARSDSAVKTKKRYKMKRGETKAVRNGEVAFIHEFGAPDRNIPARQWIRTANEGAADEAAGAAARVYDDWLGRLGNR